MSHPLTDESYIKELAKTDRKGLQRIYDAIVDFFDKIFKRYSEDARPRETEFKDALKELQGEFNTIKAMYENALKETTNVQQSKMVLPKTEIGANVLNSKESLTDSLYDDNIKSSKGGRTYGQTTNNVGGISRVFAESGDKRRGDSGNKRDIPDSVYEISDKKIYSGLLQKNVSQRSSKKGLENAVEGNEEQDYDRQKLFDIRERADDRRFQKAIENNDIRTAVEMLDNYAEKSGYFPLKLYHGTKSKDVFAIFRKESPIWVTRDNDYANAYVLLPPNLDEKQSAKLHTYKGSNVYELYVKMSKILDLGNIEEKIDSPEKLKDFCDKIGFTVDEISECMYYYKKLGFADIYLITNTPEFADLARKKGYDSLHALEDDGSVETFGILYPQNVKSSKLITYDENGDIIPLSERFNSENEDIRYSLESGEEVVIETPVKRGRIVTSAEAEASYFELKKEVQKKLDVHIKKYGAIKKGEDAVRDAQFPVQTSDDRYVRRFTRTAFEADSVTDEVAAEIVEEVANGSLWTTYSRITDKKSTDAALNRFESLGYQGILKEWEGTVASSKENKKRTHTRSFFLKRSLLNPNCLSHQK